MFVRLAANRQAAIDIAFCTVDQNVFRRRGEYGMQGGIRFKQEASSGELQVSAFYRFNIHSFSKQGFSDTQNHD
ncbi:hypothetical protein AJ87_33415 [Rhizobium yanglingense]|nr:hypothetical protein AJ87_33415 [Rhizobium yanglingense]